MNFYKHNVEKNTHMIFNKKSNNTINTTKMIFGLIFDYLIKNNLINEKNFNFNLYFIFWIYINVIFK
jgi:hypothetical protein